MVYCSKCGAQVEENMTFCPKCGAPLKPVSYVDQRRERWERRRDEKAEKQEKQEKQEKSEKYEKREYGFLGSLIGGSILIFIGLMSYLQIMGYRVWQYTGAVFTIIIGLVIIIGVITRMVRKRNPST